MHHTGISPAGLELTYMTYRIPPIDQRMGGCAEMPEPGTAAASRLIVGECIAVVDVRGAATTMPELLRAAAVSPRRLRQAFSDAYDLPPMRYLQLRVLNRAYKCLSVSGACGDTVTEVAMDLGIAHMGQFAARYRAVFGEQPSETVCRARALDAS